MMLQSMLLLRAVHSSRPILDILWRRFTMLPGSNSSSGGGGGGGATSNRCCREQPWQEDDLASSCPPSARTHLNIGLHATSSTVLLLGTAMFIF
jgi:hypothetical protein